MNQILKSLFVLSLMTNFIAYSADSCSSCGRCKPCDICCDCHLGPCDGYPYLQIRPQGRDTAREMVGWQEYIDRYNQDSTYSVLTLSVAYTRSFRNERLAHFLFGNDLVNCCELYIQGSAVDNRHAKAWMADYFGLPRDFDGRVKFCPSIQNAIVDLHLWQGFDEVAEGLYIKINAPLVWTKWQLCPCERVISAGTQANGKYLAGYMAKEEIAIDKLPTRFLKYMSGGFIFGDLTKEGLKFGRIDTCACTKTRLGEIDLTLGWNFVLEEDYHFGAYLYVAAPTGNRPCAVRLFEPMVGNGKHWEFGGGFSGSWIFSRDCECEDRYIGLWFDATLTHLFKACQCRSFDFCNKPNSRYMLLAQMGSNDDQIRGSDDGGTTYSANAEYQYKGTLIPAINWTTRNVEVKIDIQADIALKIGYVRDCWNFDLGYNLWARTGEEFCLDNCSCRDNKTYAIKGDAYLYGDTSTPTTKALSATQSMANIYKGKNYPTQNADAPLTAENNLRVDNPIFAYADTDALYKVGAGVHANNRIKTSVQPVLVTESDLNTCKSPSAISHKLFAHIGYGWQDRECHDYVPFLGIGGSVEFAQDTCSDCCDSCCNSCCDSDSCCTICECNPCCCNGRDCCDDPCSKRGGVSQWGIWIKGGVSFD